MVNLLYPAAECVQNKFHQAFFCRFWSIRFCTYFRIFFSFHKNKNIAVFKNLCICFQFIFANEVIISFFRSNIIINVFWMRNSAFMLQHRLWNIKIRSQKSFPCLLLLFWCSQEKNDVVYSTSPCSI